MPLYTYACPDGHEKDSLQNRGVDYIKCECGQTAVRQAVNRIGVAGFASTPMGQRDFRHDFRRYKEASAELDYQHKRAEESAQRKLEEPRFWQAAKRAAKSQEATSPRK